MRRFLNEWKVVAIGLSVGGLLVSATVAWARMVANEATLERHERQLDDHSRRLDSLKGDIGEVKRDVGWIRGYLEKRK